MSRGAQGLVTIVAVVLMVVLFFYVIDAADRGDDNDIPIPTIQEISNQRW